MSELTDDSEVAAAPNPLAELDQLLAIAPPQPVEFHVNDVIWVEHLTGSRIAGVVADELLEKIIPTGDHGTDPPPERMSRVLVVAPSGPLGGVIVDKNVDHNDVIHRVLLAGRHWRCPVRLFRQNNRVTGLENYDTMFIQRALPDPGRLRHRTHLTDTADRFEALIEQVDAPGRVSRAVLRRKKMTEHFRVSLDAQTLTCERVLRSGTERVEVPVADLIALVSRRNRHGNTQSDVYTTDGHQRLPAVTFGSYSYELQRWIVARINQRLGV